MIPRLLEAIADVKMQNIPEKHIVILAPVNTMVKLLQEELINGKTNPAFCLTQLGGITVELPRFNGLLVIEDFALTQIVVKSLVSEHRAVVQQ